jgi:hypothetical protein
MYQKGDFMSTGHGIYIIDLDTRDKLGLMGIPKELEISSESTWATIKVFGKNTANYHFTGAEDTLELEISWWAEDENRYQVMEQCKWLETASKRDGDLGRPHLVRLLWGTLFSKTTWIITNAPYKWMDFNQEKGLRPQCATQRVTLKRYQKDNRTHEQIFDWRT